MNDEKRVTLSPLDVALTELTLQEKSYRDIAKITGVSIATISRHLNRDECRAILEIGMQQQIALIPRAVEVLCQNMRDDDKWLRQKSSETIMKNTGLAPSGAPVTMIQNILNVQATETPQIIRDLFDAVQQRDCAQAIGDDEAVDV